MANVAKGNTSQYDGGALAYFADETHCAELTVYASSFEGNSIAGASSGAGLSGRVTNPDGRAYWDTVFFKVGKKTRSTLENTYVSNLVSVDVHQSSFAANDGAISTQGASPLAISDSTFMDNTATYRGGGAIRSEKGSLVVTDSFFANNMMRKSEHTGTSTTRANVAELGGGAIWHE